MHQKSQHIPITIGRASRSWGEPIRAPPSFDAAEGNGAGQNPTSPSDLP
jgi:hypothetical protein